MLNVDFMKQSIAAAAACKPANADRQPKVGAVIVVDGKVIATGSRGADDHAEKVALSQVVGMVALDRATVYTTLEPCTRHVRRGARESCTDRLIDAKVAKVVVGMLDPNQEVCGRGISQLQESKIEVELFPGDLVNAIMALNDDFIRAQRSLRVTFVDPEPTLRTREFSANSSATFLCECTTEPGADVFMIAEKDGVWWPKAYGLVWISKRTWGATLNFGPPGIETIHVVKANELGRRLVNYYRNVVAHNEAKRRAFENDANARAYVGLLTSDHVGIEMGDLPKGIDSLARVTIRVA